MAPSTIKFTSFWFPNSAVLFCVIILDLKNYSLYGLIYCASYATINKRL